MQMPVVSLRLSGKSSKKNMHLNICSPQSTTFFFSPCISLWLVQRATHRSPLHFPTDQTGRDTEICASDHAAAVARQRDYVHSLLLGNQHFPSHTHTAKCP